MMVLWRFFYMLLWLINGSFSINKKAGKQLDSKYLYKQQKKIIEKDSCKEGPVIIATDIQSPENIADHLRYVHTPPPTRASQALWVNQDSYDTCKYPSTLSYYCLSLSPTLMSDLHLTYSLQVDHLLHWKLERVESWHHLAMTVRTDPFVELCRKVWVPALSCPEHNQAGQVVFSTVIKMFRYYILFYFIIPVATHNWELFFIISH